ncbi:MAG: ABC transporter ATP-binding protein [Parvibaculaceae bacterium]
MTNPAANARQTALAVESLDAYYAKCQVLFGAQFSLRRGEIVALLGRNGAGKTTTLMAIAGFVSVKRGKIRLGDQDIVAMAPFRRVRSGLALTPSGSRSFGSLTVHENLQMSANIEARAPRWTIDKIYELFPKLKVLTNSNGSQLSGGERQMLAVGRALLSQPDVLMLDEPSEGLAPMIVRELGVILRRLRSEGLGVLLTEQNHVMAMDVADRVLFMEKGQILWEGTAAQAAAPEVIGRYLAV